MKHIWVINPRKVDSEAPMGLTATLTLRDWLVCSALPTFFVHLAHPLTPITPLPRRQTHVWRQCATSLPPTTPTAAATTAASEPARECFGIHFHLFIACFCFTDVNQLKNTFLGRPVTAPRLRQRRRTEIFFPSCKSWEALKLVLIFAGKARSYKMWVHLRSNTSSNWNNLFI